MTVVFATGAGVLAQLRRIPTVMRINATIDTRWFIVDTAQKEIQG
jgi:hypothetical protein